VTGYSGPIPTAIGAVLLSILALLLTVGPPRGFGAFGVALLATIAVLSLIRIIARAPTSALTRVLPPLLLGATLLLMWEVGTRAYQIPSVILPPVSAIAQRMAESTDILWQDFVQTILKGALSGYVIGAAAGVMIAIASDRVPFLQRGLLPIGNFLAAMPIIGIAPILVMWFGFDWHSKAAVVAVMCFFPMLVSTVEGLSAADAMQRDLMRTYAASYWQSLLKLRLPVAAPFLLSFSARPPEEWGFASQPRSDV